jgi:hypothetical protein
MLIFYRRDDIPPIETVNLSSWPIAVKNQAVTLFKKEDSIGLLHHIHCHDMKGLSYFRRIRELQSGRNSDSTLALANENILAYTNVFHSSPELLNGMF